MSELVLGSRRLALESSWDVIVAGRSISADRTVNGSLRIMACCLNTGEAAGIAAAMAARADHDVHQVDTENLRAALRKHGAYLP